ncbi:MAG TPA: hypothetical protein C5S37_06070 [Methanophagales archaeon]|nr:hypothetical protein [Methanophagales archaeon]
MNKKEKNYSIHDIVTFKIIDKANSISRFFSNIELEYKNFESTEINDPDLTVYLGDFTPSNQECCILDNEYYVKEDYFYCKDSYKIAKWGLEISGFESGNMEVRLSTNSSASMIISGFIIDPLIIFKMNERGYPIVHGSCVSKDNCAHLFTAQGGGGKTSTALYAVERGFNFLGDNFIIIDKGYARSFLSPLNIFSFNLIPIVKRNMGIKNKVEFQLKNLLYKMTGLRIVTKINVKSVFPDSLDDKSKLESIFLLIPKEKYDIVEIDKEELIGHMVANMKLDSFPFIKYMMEYSYMFPESMMATHWGRYEANLGRKLSKDITIYKVELPPRYDQKTFENIFKVMERIKIEERGKHEIEI